MRGSDKVCSYILVGTVLYCGDKRAVHLGEMVMLRGARIVVKCVGEGTTQ